MRWLFGTVILVNLIGMVINLHKGEFYPALNNTTIIMWVVVSWLWYSIAKRKEKLSDSWHSVFIEQSKLIREQKNHIGTSAKIIEEYKTNKKLQDDLIAHLRKEEKNEI